MGIFNNDLSEETKIALTDIEKQFISMRSSGDSVRKIAKSLKKSTRTICKWNRIYYRNIVEMNTEEFAELRKKIVKFKNTRIDFLMEEFKNIKEAMIKSESLYDKKNWNYEGYLETLMKVSKLVDKFESDLLVPSPNYQNAEDSMENEIESKQNTVTVLEENTETENDEKQENTVPLAKNENQIVSTETTDNT
jgi:hypothetical protein